MKIISQNLKNVLKNKIKILINPILYKFVDLLVDTFSFDTNTSTNYFELFSNVQLATRDCIKSIIVSTFEQIDEDFKNSYIRKSRYYINKSNVSRTLTTIIGTSTFSRTYYIYKHSNKRFKI